MEVKSDLPAEAPKGLFPYALRYGVMAGMLASLMGIVVYFIGMEYNQGLQWAGFIFPIVFAVVAMISYKKDNSNWISMGQGFKLGMLFFLIYAVFVAVFSLLYMEVINPEYLAGMMETSIDKMEDRGMSDEEIEMAMEYSGFFMKVPVILAIGFFVNMILGLIVSAIAAAVVKSD